MKDEFCEAYKKNEGFIAEKIQHEANLERLKSDSETSEKIKAAQEEIEKLKKDLEREQEWKPYNDTENVSQFDYDKLAKAAGTKELTDDEAKSSNLRSKQTWATQKNRGSQPLPYIQRNRLELYTI